jgi:hypothetical protein
MSSQAEQPIARHIRHCKDLNFSVVAEIHRHRVDFAIYDISGYAVGETVGVYDVPEYPSVGQVSSMHTTANLEDAEVYLHGEVKWDGCSNWHFDEQDRVMLHGCSKADIQRFGDVMALCWDWTAELCPSWDA